MQSEHGIPQEILSSIFAYLDPLSLSAAAQASRLFYRIATAPLLWQLHYSLRWSTGDVQRESRRTVLPWRRHHAAQRLETFARRALRLAELSSEEQQRGRQQEDPCPFAFFRPSSSSNGRREDTFQEPDFYRLFLERIRIDQQVLDLLYQQVQATHSRIPAAEELASRFGSDAKDVLHAVIQAQLSAPSGSSHGRMQSLDKGKRNQTDVDVRHGRDRSNGHGEAPASYRLRAYDAHLPTTMRSDSHHLVILHHARELLEHLQRSEAMHRLQLLDSAGSTATTLGEHDALFDLDKTEGAVSLLSMFRGGELLQIRTELDSLAAACDLYLQSVKPELAQQQRQRGARDQLFPTEMARELAPAIGDFLKENGFRGARPGLFQDLDNHFLHHCLTTNRETIPLSLTVIFCAIANRLGLKASLCNFPTRILAVINFSSSSHQDQDDRFWFDVAEYTSGMARAQAGIATQPGPDWRTAFPPILDKSDLQKWTSQLRLSHQNAFVIPAKAEDMVVRAARNIVASVQRAQILPMNARPGEGARARSDAAEARTEGTSPAAGRYPDGRERPDRLFCKLIRGWVPREDQDAVYQLGEGDAIAPPPLLEDWSAWEIRKRWRGQSLDDSGSPHSESGLDGGAQFRAWIEARRNDDDWTGRLVSQRNRATQWSEHEQQASMYAAANGFVRLTDELGDRGGDWMSGLVQSYFALDVGLIQREFLDRPSSTAAHGSGATRGSGERRGEEDHSESGSDSSFEGSFSGREERGEQTAPTADAGAARTYIRNPDVRCLLNSMMSNVRSKDALPPRVNRRNPVSQPATGRRDATSEEAATNGSLSEGPVAYQPKPDPEATDNGGAGDPVTFRVGTLFRHRTYGYLACVLGWDPYCAAPEEWIRNMGVDQLPPPASSASLPQMRSSAYSADDFAASPTSPLFHDGFKSARMKREKKGGRHQPFYHSQVADGTRRYVAEVNVDPVVSTTTGMSVPGAAAAVTLERDVRTLLRLRGLGEYFRCYDARTKRMRRNSECREMFPDDLSDDEGEEFDGAESDQGKGQQEQQQQKGALGLELHPVHEGGESDLEGDGDRVSEDGSW